MKHFFFGLSTAFLSGIMALIALPVGAQDYGLNAAVGAAKLVLPTSRTPFDIVGDGIGIALSLVGVIFFILMIYSGITWMVARGNEEQTKKSLQTITAAIIGLVIVISAYAITTFVFESISGSG